MARTGYRTVTPSQPWNREATLVLQGVVNGKTNNVFDVVMATGTAVTQVSFPLIGPDSYIHAVPTNTYAASLAAPWFDTQAAGAAVFHHVTATATAGFRVLVVG
jgi:hypothetical protein